MPHGGGPGFFWEWDPPDTRDRRRVFLEGLAAGLPVAFDERRGFGHAAFVPLEVAFPAADVPCVRLSLREGLDPAENLAAGRALSPLRDRGVRIVGSSDGFHDAAVSMRPLRGGAEGVAGVDRGVETLEDRVIGAVESAFRFR